MFSVITTLILVFGVLFGGSGITLAAAQSSLPDQPLYGLKLWTEQVQYSLAGEDVESQMQLSMQFANRRMEEISAMLTNGNVSDQAALTRLQYRYQAQIENSMRLAAGLPGEEEVLAALDETKTEIGIHIRKLDQDRIQGRTGAPEHAVLANIQAMLQERLKWLEAGIVEPNQLRYRLEEQLKLQAQRPVDGETETPVGDDVERGLGRRAQQRRRDGEIAGGIRHDEATIGGEHDDAGIRGHGHAREELHEGAGLEEFLDREQERYRPQLERYAALDEEAQTQAVILAAMGITG